MSTIRAKTDGKNKIMLEISHFPPRGCRARVKILSDSLQCDPQAQVRKKEDMFRHDVHSRIAKIFPGLARISIGKMPSRGPKKLRRPLFAKPYCSSPSSVFHKSRTLRKRVAQAFQRYQERRKPTSGARSTLRANTNKK
jgi:hypothetical protein